MGVELDARRRRRSLWRQAVHRCVVVALLAALSIMLIVPASAQTAAPTAFEREELEAMNPITWLQQAGKALPIGDGDPQGDVQPVSTERDGGFTGPMSILIILTVLTVAPALLVLTTSFTRIVIVLSLLRQAIGTQSLPPSQVIVGLAMFMTFLVMSPTFERLNAEFILPMQDGQFLNNDQAWQAARQPIRDFMFAQIDYADNWQDVYMILEYRGIDTTDPGSLRRKDVDMVSLVPAFILSELKVAFLMGFRLYLPFLIIDMVISSVLISMGMLMLPPVLISLPFKLLLFVLADGWRLVVGNLLNSFVLPGAT